MTHFTLQLTPKAPERLRRLAGTGWALLFLGFAPGTAGAQFLSPDAFTGVATIEPESRLMEMLPETQVPASQFFQAYAGSFRLGPLDRMILLDTATDERGTTSFTYQQTFNGIPVLDARFSVRERKGRVESANGIIQSGLKVNTTPVLSEHTARALALRAIGASKYMWQDSSHEARLREEMDDTLATYEPKGELWIASPHHAQYASDDFYDGGTFVLTWAFQVFAEQPMSHEWIYVDARTGEVVKRRSLINPADHLGTAQTMYEGTRSILTDYQGGHFRLRESGRGHGIRTFDMNQTYSLVNAVDFVDGDNHWEPNGDLDEAAWNAHWALEEVFDYYQDVHGRNSFNGKGKRVNAYVHRADEDGAAWWANAFWDGQRICFGDGYPMTDRGTPTNPYTSLDVAAHEFTHAVTQYTVGLVYENESGALNESISDMFAAAVEEHVLGPDNMWRMGEDLYFTASWEMRDMSNPSRHGHPDTYKGTNWVSKAKNPSNSNDQGGVHTNSGVGNYWFYLLSDGGSGTNDNGTPYDVSGIGISKASRVVYEALGKKLLTPASGYRDFMHATISAAKELYGKCSREYWAVVLAWRAVGLQDIVKFQWHNVTDKDLKDCRHGIVVYGDHLTIKSGAELESQSMLQINFKPGFQAERGCTFRARIGCCD